MIEMHVLLRIDSCHDLSGLYLLIEQRYAVILIFQRISAAVQLNALCIDVHERGTQ